MFQSPTPFSPGPCETTDGTREPEENFNKLWWPHPGTFLQLAPAPASPPVSVSELPVFRNCPALRLSSGSVSSGSLRDGSSIFSFSSSINFPYPLDQYSICRHTRMFWSVKYPLLTITSLVDHSLPAHTHFSASLDRIPPLPLAFSFEPPSLCLSSLPLPSFIKIVNDFHPDECNGHLLVPCVNINSIWHRWSFPFWSFCFTWLLGQLSSKVPSLSLSLLFLFVDSSSSFQSLNFGDPQASNLWIFFSTCNQALENLIQCLWL